MQAPVPILSVVTYPPGATNTQERLVIDGVRGAIFQYRNGGPVGALVSSWAISAGTDPYGNAYPAGINLTEGSFSGPDYDINANGIFFYSGTPAFGNLIVSLAGTAGTDQFGNVYPQGLDVSVGEFAGTNFVINSAGAFFYSGTPAAGNLQASIANANGTDAVGNAYLGGGLALYNPSGGSVSDPAVVIVYSGNNIAAWQAPSQAGPYVQIDGLQISYIMDVIGTPGILELGGGVAGTVIEFAQPIDTPLESVQPGTPYTVESWHSITLPTGGTFAGTIRFKVIPLANFAVCDVNMTFTTTAAGAQYNSNGLTNSAYWPTNHTVYAPLVVNQAYTTAANAVPRIGITTGGTVEVFMPAFVAAGNTTIVVGTFIYPLD